MSNLRVRPAYKSQSSVGMSHILNEQLPTLVDSCQPRIDREDLDRQRCVSHVHPGLHLG